MDALDIMILIAGLSFRRFQQVMAGASDGGCKTRRSALISKRNVPASSLHLHGRGAHEEASWRFSVVSRRKRPDSNKNHCKSRDPTALDRMIDLTIASRNVNEQTKIRQFCLNDADSDERNYLAPAAR